MHRKIDNLLMYKKIEPLQKDIFNRFKGCLYGQAIGDALGLGTEGMTDEDMAWKYPHGLHHYSQIFQDRHRKRWKVGDWTDDTDMMLCIAHAIIEDKGVNFTNIVRHFKMWAMDEPMGIGENTYKVLNIADYVEKPFDVSRMVWKMSRCQSAANGGLMRTSVVGLFPKCVTDCAGNICKLTHYDPRCVGSCVIVSSRIHALVYGGKVPDCQDMINTAMEYEKRIADFINLAWNENDITKLMDDDHMGYTLVTLSVALWAYWHAVSFEEGLLAVVNASGDADTNAAVACAILGAKFGFCTIPQEYVEGLIYKDQLDDTVDGLWHVCNMRQNNLH
jgi:ADP-ribosylglycohydrolase